MGLWFNLTSPTFLLLRRDTTFVFMCSWICETSKPLYILYYRVPFSRESNPHTISTKETERQKKSKTWGVCIYARTYSSRMELLQAHWGMKRWSWRLSILHLICNGVVKHNGNVRGGHFHLGFSFPCFEQSIGPSDECFRCKQSEDVLGTRHRTW